MDNWTTTPVTLAGLISTSRNSNVLTLMPAFRNPQMAVLCQSQSFAVTLNLTT